VGRWLLEQLEEQLLTGGRDPVDETLPSRSGAGAGHLLHRSLPLEALEGGVERPVRDLPETAQLAGELPRELVAVHRAFLQEAQDREFQHVLSHFDISDEYIGPIYVYHDDHVRVDQAAHGCVRMNRTCWPAPSGRTTGITGGDARHSRGSRSPRGDPATVGVLRRASRQEGDRPRSGARGRPRRLSAARCGSLRRLRRSGSRTRWSV